VVPEIALVAAATLAAASWSVSAWRRRPFPRRPAAAVAAWALISTAVCLVEHGGSPAARWFTLLLLLLGAALVLYGVSGLMRLAIPAGTTGAVLAEAVLVSASLITLLWVLVTPAEVPVAPALAALVPAVVELATLALIVRLPAAVPGLVWRSMVDVAGSAVAITLVFAGHAADGLRALGVDAGIGQGTASGLTAAGFLIVALAPLAEDVQQVGQEPPTWLRTVPYAFVTVAVAAVCVQAAAGGTGAVPVVLVGVVVASLVVLQAVGLRENARLLADLESSRRGLAALVENTSDLIVRLDENGRVIAANAAAVRLLHRTPTSLAGRSFEGLAHAEDRREVREAVLAVTRGRQMSAQVELRLASPATGTAQLRLRAVPGGAVANLNDVTDAVELRRRLERMARYDQMTGLLNRAHLLEVIGGWLTDPELPVAVLYADLDGFKAVNDRFGHGAGDRVLIDVATRLEAIAGGLSQRRVVVSRVGGDEFIVGIEGVAPADARAAAQRVVEALVPSFRLGGRTVQLGVSVGVAGVGAGYRGEGVPPGEVGAAELVHRADLAMYEAKSAGRARVGDWSPALEARARRRVDIAIGLRGALDSGRLALAYQPIVRLSDGVVVGVEALLRLPSAVDAAVPGLDALVSPAELVAVAEDTGAITEVGEWVLAQAVQQAADWAAEGYEIGVTVNVSVQQLLAPGFVDSVTSAVRGCDLLPSRLVLELTESQVAGQPGPAIQALQRLRASGVRLAIDDFGTGYSSLSYLRHLPVQVVKLDRSLLDGIGTDPRAAGLVRAVVVMSRDLGLSVVVEGLEDLATARIVRELGANAGQGYALSPALPPERLRALLDGDALDVGLDLPAPVIPSSGEVPITATPLRPAEANGADGPDGAVRSAQPV
jgi:diguanylate cyclase (GGDEF)-like protein/PAS domain S-box-containing protein